MSGAEGGKGSERTQRGGRRGERVSTYPIGDT